jgi:hypothetical protein
LITVKFDNVAYFDVDETLLIYNIPDDRLGEAFQLCIPDRELFKATVVPHYEHIERLKLHKAWGNGVIVWSRSGFEWAEAAVRALGLEDYVDACIAKPMYYYDDKECCDILGEHRYLLPKEGPS